MATQAMPQIFDNRKQFKSLKKLVVAHDFSLAADRALTDAIAISSQFHSEIVIAHVKTSEPSSPGVLGSGNSENQLQAAMEALRRRVRLADHPCKEVVRLGRVAETLVEINHEEVPDLLLLGAYGNGSKDRATLGSTAELLLRSIPCPVLTYGPKVAKALLLQSKEPMSILVPIELPCAPRYLSFAVGVAKMFNAKLEVLHVVDMDHALSMPHAFQDMQYACEEIAMHLRDGEVKVSGSLLFGKPDAAIVLRSQELHSSLIMMPLETRGHLSSAASDNVAANVIRNAEVPVMTYRID